jgi:hypothetical protein
MGKHRAVSNYRHQGFIILVAGIADIQEGFRVGIAMDSDTDPQASCSSSPAMKITVPSSTG